MLTTVVLQQEASGPALASLSCWEYGLELAHCHLSCWESLLAAGTCLSQSYTPTRRQPVSNEYKVGTTLKDQPPLQNPTWNDWGLSWNLTGVSFSTVQPCLLYLPRGLYLINFCIQLSTLEPSCRELTLKPCLPEVPLSSNVIVPFTMCGSYTVYYLLKNPSHLFCRIFHVLDLADSIPVSSFILILSVNR